MFSPARTDASRNAAARGLSVPSSTRSDSLAALSTNFFVSGEGRWVAGQLLQTNGGSQRGTQSMVGGQMARTGTE